jgi:hypothetical protein
VVLVKLDSPKGAHYAGGDIAAPVTKVVLRAALAARDAALDRHDLAASEKTAVASKAGDAATIADADSKSRGTGDRNQPSADSYDPNGNMTSERATEATTSYVVALPARPKPASIAIAPRAVPDVRDLSVREAVRALHNAGFRVKIAGLSGAGTLPAAGTVVPPGTLIQLSRSIE